MSEVATFSVEAALFLSTVRFDYHNCQMYSVSKYGVFSGPYFPVFGPEETPYWDTFYAVLENVRKPISILPENLRKALDF